MRRHRATALSTWLLCATVGLYASSPRSTAASQADNDPSQGAQDDEPRRRAQDDAAENDAVTDESSISGEGAEPPEAGGSGGPAQGQSDAFRRFSRPPEGYARVVATMAFGRGLRFNNPYRLQTQLGGTAESLSLTASYIDLGAAMSFGAPNGLQHGAALHFSAALTGVSQQILTPSYFAAYRGPYRVLGYGRLGPAIILSPDAGVGAELAGACAVFLTAKVGVYAELVGNLFYGAGTTEVKYAVYPIVSGQLGIMIDHELLP